MGADYSNARCTRNYIYDSGWKYILDAQASSIVDNYGYTYLYGKSYFTWNKNKVCIREGSYSTCKVGDYTYYRGATRTSGGGGYTSYIKRTRELIEYRSFSSF